MEEVGQNSDKGSRSFKIDPKYRSIVLAIFTLLLIVIVVISGNLRADQTRISELERSANALSEALEPQVLASAPDKLDRILIEIAKAGNYKEVTVSDNSGRVIATTNATRRGTTSEILKNSPKQAKAIRQKGETIIRRAIILAGDTRYGNLEMRLSP